MNVDPRGPGAAAGIYEGDINRKTSTESRTVPVESETAAYCGNVSHQLKSLTFPKFNLEYLGSPYVSVPPTLHQGEEPGCAEAQGRLGQRVNIGAAPEMSRW